MHKRLIGGIATALLPLVSHSIAGTGSYGYTRQAAAKQQRLSTHYTPWQPKQEPISRSYLESANIKVTSQSLELQSGQTARELVIIDSAIPDKHVIYQNNAPGVDVVEIDSSKDGLSQLKKILAQYHQLDAMHLFSHATDGVIQLGNRAIDADLLKKEVNTLASIDSAMKEGADVYFYGCNLAETEQGEQLLELISHQANVDVAASSDTTGHETLGGDWDLEISKGDINTQVRYDSIAMNEFEMVLPFTGRIGLGYGELTGNPSGYFASHVQSVPGTPYTMTFATDDGSDNLANIGNSLYVSYYDYYNHRKTYIDVDPGNDFDLDVLNFDKQGPDFTLKISSNKGGVVTYLLDLSADQADLTFTGPLWEDITRITIENNDGSDMPPTKLSYMDVIDLGPTPAPGGVSDGLNLWLRADQGIPETTGAISSWIDQTGINTFNSMLGDPEIGVQQYNFNQVVQFSGNDRFDGTVSISTAESYVVGEFDDTGGSSGIFFGKTSGNNTYHFFQNTPTTLFLYDGARAFSITPPATDMPHVFAGNTDLTENFMRVDGVNQTLSNSSPTIRPIGGVPRIGNRANLTNPNLQGAIAEIVSFDDTQSTIDRQKIESYLAIKYGITLGVATPAYTDSSGNGVFFYDGVYDNDVFAIGQDDGSELDQRVSKSVNPGALVTVALDSDFTSANDDPVNRSTAHANDGEFIFFSNNGDSGNQITEMEAAYDSRTSREWKVSVATSFTSDFHLQFDGYDDQWVLLKSADDDFSDNDQTVVARLDVNGIIAISNADLGNGARFILASSADTTPPPTPSCSTTPSPANTGTAVTMLCTGIETAALVSTPGMSCGAEDNGSVTCTGTIGTAGLLVSNDTVTVTDAVNNSNTSATTGLIIDDIPPAGPGVLTGPSGDTSDSDEDIVGSCGADAANGSVKVTTTPANGFTVMYDTDIALDANGAFTIVDPNWSDGTYTVEYACNDETGNGPTNLGPFGPITVDLTPPTEPVCSSTPSPAAAGEDVVTTCTGVEVGSTLTIPNMVCSPAPADASGEVTCTGVAGTDPGRIQVEMDTVTVIDVLGNVNTDADTGLELEPEPAPEEERQPLIVGTDGIAGGSMSLLGLIFLMFATFTRSVRGVRKKVVIGATLALMSVCLTSPVFAQEGDFYVGLGVGPTSFNPLENGSSTIVTDDSDIGHQWLAGYDFTNRIAIEAFYGEYGAAQTDVPGSLDYHEVFGAGLVLTLTNANKTEGLSSYVSIGIANLDVDSGSVPFIQDNGGQIYGGIGLRYTVNDGFSGRLEYKDISGDAHMFSINITKRFRLFK